MIPFSWMSLNLARRHDTSCSYSSIQAKFRKINGSSLYIIFFRAIINVRILNSDEPSPKTPVDREAILLDGGENPCQCRGLTRCDDTRAWSDRRMFRHFTPRRSRVDGASTKKYFRSGGSIIQCGGAQKCGV